jgi:hypothetical protein
MNIKYIVITCDKYHYTRVNDVRQTWGDGENLLFLSDGNVGDDIIGYEYLQRGYENIWMKLYEFLKNNSNFDDDWYLFADDDTYVNKKNIITLLNNYKPEDAICIGHVGLLNSDATDMDGNFTGFPLQTISGEKTILPIRYVSGGAGFILSRTSMKLICDYLTNLEYQKVPRSYNSDVTFGFWMRNCGILIKDVKGFWWTNPSELNHDLNQINESFTYHYIDSDNMFYLKNICQDKNIPTKCIVTQSKDQSVRLKDWILYHFDQGFDTFVFFDDFSEDDSVSTLKKLKNDYGINIIIKYSDGIGNRKSKEDMSNSETYGGDVSINYRILRSYNVGLNLLKKLNPDSICAFIDVDEFLVSNNSEKVSETISRIMSERNIDLVYIHSFDIKNVYPLKEWYISDESTSLRWDFNSRLSSDYKNRGKSVCIVKSLQEIKQMPNYVHQLREIQEFEAERISVDDYKLLRIHHFRNPNLIGEAIQYTNDFTLIEKAKSIKNKYQVNYETI